MSKKLDNLEVKDPESPRFGGNQQPSKAGLYGQPQHSFIK